MMEELLMTKYKPNRWNGRCELKETKQKLKAARDKENATVGKVAASPPTSVLFIRFWILLFIELNFYWLIGFGSSMFWLLDTFVRKELRSELRSNSRSEI